MLSRNPLVTTGDESTVEPVSTYVDSIDTFHPISDIRVEQLKIATQNDTTLQDVIKYTIQGWPSFTNTPQNIRIYANEQNHLSYSKSLLLYDDRIVVPSSLRKDILVKLHEGHPSVSQMKNRAYDTVWWPRMSREIQEEAEKCETCQIQKRAQQKLPLVPTPLPELPWEKVGADLCELDNKHFLAMID